MFFKIRCIGFTSWRSKFLGFTRSTLASHICSTDSIPWVHHSREEGYLGYDGRHVRLQVYLKFNMIIHRQQWLGATLAADVFCSHVGCWRVLYHAGCCCGYMHTNNHVSGSRWPTCQDLIGPCVMILLGHVSGSDWSMCHDLIGPRVRIWLVHVSWSYLASCLYLIGPCVRILLAHVSGSYWPTCLDLIAPRVLIILYHMSLPYRAMCLDPVRPCVRTLLGHVSWFCWSTCLDIIVPRVAIWLAHVSLPDCTTCPILVGPRVVIWWCHVHRIAAHKSQLHFTIFWTSHNT
jgi:hypothetical protein